MSRHLSGRPAAAPGRGSKGALKDPARDRSVHDDAHTQKTDGELTPALGRFNAENGINIVLEGAFPNPTRKDVRRRRSSRRSRGGSGPSTTRSGSTSSSARRVIARFARFNRPPESDASALSGHVAGGRLSPRRRSLSSWLEDRHVALGEALRDRAMPRHLPAWLNRGPIGIIGSTPSGGATRTRANCRRCCFRAALSVSLFSSLPAFCPAVNKVQLLMSTYARGPRQGCRGDAR